jgi:2-polyprenyl-6-methoxyphenol hydroxylase-like FAD-dependent oxidoreductase
MIHGMKKSIILLFAIAICSLVSAELSVVVIGGGPAGLATAIEAAEHGAKVIIVEKRSSYTRDRLIFLFESTLTLLDRWKVNIPQMKVAEFEEVGKLGFASINQIEEALATRVQELGIHKIYGEFKGLKNKKAVIASSGQEVYLSYDILVGAEGTHSLVRKELGIACEDLGKGVGMWAISIFDAPRGEPGLSPTLQKRGFFLRKINIPPISIVNIQTSSIDRITQAEFEKLTLECGWTDEAEMISTSKARISKCFEIPLQQAHCFSCEENSAILVGDAAATASFFEGMGANTALKTAAIAGTFFKQEEDSYQIFNQQMKEATDALIEDSYHLFKP